MSSYPEQTLTKKIAEKFRKKSGYKDDELRYFEYITDEAAEILSTSKKKLHFKALRELSVNSAESLANHNGELEICNLTELRDDVAESLSKHKGDLLELSTNSFAFEGLVTVFDGNPCVVFDKTGTRIIPKGNLMKISDAAAESLSKHQGKLILGGLGDAGDDVILSDAAVESLANHNGELQICITELSDAAAESLSKHKGDLYVYGLEKISDTAAQHLASYQGTGIDLPNLIEATEAVVEFWINTKRPKDFHWRNGLPSKSTSWCNTRDLRIEIASISDSAAQILSKHKGVLLLPNLRECSLAVKESLLKHKGKINGETPKKWANWVIETKVLTKEIAEEYLDDETFELNEFTSVGDSVAKVLCKAKNLDLSGLTRLSDASAESLSKVKGELDLSGLALSDAAAESLSKHQGNLILDLGGISSHGIGDLGESCRGGELSCPAVVELLSKHKGKINGMDPKEWYRQFLW